MRTLLILTCIAALAGCASTPYTGASYANDVKYMNQVEQSAALGNAQVHWVNPPVSRIDNSAPEIAQ